MDYKRKDNYLLIMNVYRSSRPGRDPETIRHSAATLPLSHHHFLGGKSLLHIVMVTFGFFLLRFDKVRVECTSVYRNDLASLDIYILLTYNK